MILFPFLFFFLFNTLTIGIECLGLDETFRLVVNVLNLFAFGVVRSLKGMILRLFKLNEKGFGYFLLIS